VVTDWRRLCREAALKVEDSTIRVTFADGRGHRVTVEGDPDAGELRLWAVAAPPSAVAKADDEPHMVAWKRNRASDLVGFKVDGRGRLIGEAWVPTASLHADEWATYVQAVARSCDRVEYLLTGRDEE
jgi:hypothetical protein